MKITIDTKEDSQEDILKIMQVLATLKGNPGNLSLQNITPADTSNLMSMFDDSSNSSGPAPASSPSDFSSFLSLTKQAGEKKEEDLPRIQVY